MHYAALILAIMIPDVVHAHITEVLKVDHIVTAIRDEATARIRGAGSTCDSRGPWQSASYRVKDDARDLKWTRRGCRLEMHIEGDVAFNADFTAITRVPRGGEVRFEQRGEVRRELRLAERRDGRLGVSYKVNGQQQPLNAAGRAWMAEMVQLMLRNTGMGAEERVALLLSRGGHDAVLAELPYLGGDRVQRLYLAELMTQARLNGAAYQATMRAASENISSDHEWQIFVEESAQRAEAR